MLLSPDPLEQSPTGHRAPAGRGQEHWEGGRAAPGQSPQGRGRGGEGEIGGAQGPASVGAGETVDKA